MAVGLGSETPFYVELEPIYGVGAPSVRVTVYNVEGSQQLQVRRTAGGETQVVQGAFAWGVTGVGILTDWAVPFNRESVYTVYVDGEPQFTQTVTVVSDAAWLQDPLNPTGAIRVEDKKLVPGSLLLDSKAIGSAKYSAPSTEVLVMGAKYPRHFSGQRSGAQDVSLSMWSDDEDTESGLRNMVADAPILLFRPLPEHRLLPPVVYLSGDAVEDQRTVRLGQDLTHWTISGNLVQAVLQAVVSGFITYQEVQDLLGGYTYAEVQAAANSTLYLDWLKNPLIFSNL